MYIKLMPELLLQVYNIGRAVCPYAQGVHSILRFFPRISNILRPLPRKDRAAIGCTKNGQPIRVTVHSDLRSDELISYMQEIGCSKFGKNTIFNEHPVRKQHTRVKDISKRVFVFVFVCLVVWKESQTIGSIKILFYFFFFC